MEVLLESEEQMGRNKPKRRGKRQRPAGPPAASPAVVAEQTGRLLAEREREWLERLTTDPASFAAVELEVHEQARRQADPLRRRAAGQGQRAARDGPAHRQRDCRGRGPAPPG